MFSLFILQHGYTFVAEGRSLNASIPTGKFRMRLIGAAEPLPTPIKEGTINTHFTMKETRDYYVPNRKNVIFRYLSLLDACWGYKQAKL